MNNISISACTVVCTKTGIGEIGPHFTLLIKSDDVSVMQGWSQT